MNRGFLRTPRRWYRSAEWQTKRTFSRFEAALSLLEQATYCEQRYVRMQQGCIKMRRGQIATTLRSLAERWGWSKSAVARYLESLSADTPARGLLSISTRVIQGGTVSDTLDGTVGETVGGTKFGTTLTLITITDYDDIVASADGGGTACGTVGGTVSGTVGGTSSGTVIYSIENKDTNKSSKKRENECMGNANSHTHNFYNNFNNLPASNKPAATDVEKSQSAVQETAYAVKDSQSQEKENVAPKEKEATHYPADGSAAPVHSSAEHSDAHAAPAVGQRPEPKSRLEITAENMVEWLKVNYPDLAAMRSPLTVQEALWLLRDFSIKDIKFIIDRMQSKETFLRNTRFYSTFISFARHDSTVVRRNN